MFFYIFFSNILYSYSIYNKKAIDIHFILLHLKIRVNNKIGLILGLIKFHFHFHFMSEIINKSVLCSICIAGAYSIYTICKCLLKRNKKDLYLFYILFLVKYLLLEQVI